MTYRRVRLALALCTLTLACSGSSAPSHPAADAQADAKDAVAGDVGVEAGCHGNEGAWAKLTGGPISCTKNSDCCVVVNGCLSQSQIVAASTEVAAKAAWPYCNSDCNLCIPPSIRVFCSGGKCAGTVVDLTSDGGGMNLTVDHCGVDEPAGTPADKLHFTCGG